MKKVMVIAKTTLQEMIRERLFIVVIFMAAVLFGVSLLLGALSFREQQRILANLGFTAIEVAEKRGRHWVRLPWCCKVRVQDVIVVEAGLDAAVAVEGMARTDLVQCFPSGARLGKSRSEGSRGQLIQGVTARSP